MRYKVKDPVFNGFATAISGQFKLIDLAVRLSSAKCSCAIGFEAVIDFPSIQKSVNDNAPVCIVGLPCQIVSLQKAFGESLENVVYVDLSCDGLLPHNMEVQLRSGEIGEAYFRGIKEGLLCRRSCHNCRFVGDFGFGDFTIDCNANEICVNNDRAMKWAERMSLTDRLTVVQSGFKLIADECDGHPVPHPNYERFWAWMKSSTDKADICKKIDEYLNLSDGIAVLNFHDARGNYGSVLTAYALQEKIRQMVGFAPVHISLWDGFKEEISDLRDFTKEHILETAPCRSDAELRKLNRYFQTFIVGPDVVWKNAGFYGSFYKFLLDFAAFSKNICSYAPSFKFPKLMNSKPGSLVNVEAPPDDVLRRKRLMKRFNHVSVREDFGVILCKEAFDVDAELVLDAALLLEAEDYEKLFSETDYQLPADTTVTYLLNWSNVPHDIADAVRANPSVRHLREGNDFSNVQLKEGIRHKGARMVDWLKSIHDCKCLITDSYHGMIFAIVFKRPFVLFRHGEKTGTVSYKLDSLMRLLGIEGRFASTKEDFNRISSTPIDYGPVYEKLAHWRNVSENFLRKVLDDNKPNKTRAWMESLEIQNQILAQEQNAKLQGLLALYGRLSRIKHYIQSPRELIGKSLRKCLRIARGK